MVIYTCPICCKEFKKISHFKDHTENKKKPCQPMAPKCSQMLPNAPKCSQMLPNAEKNNEFFDKNDGIFVKTIENFKNNIDEFSEEFEESENPVISCNNCGKIFCKKSNLNRHIKNNICKKLDEENQQLKSEILTYKKELENQNKQINELKQLFYEMSKNNKGSKRNSKTINNNNTMNNNITNITNNNQNINIILPHGKELEKIQLNEVLDLMLTYDFNDMVPNLIKYIYLNKDKPENQNFLVNDIARNRCKYYNGEKWITGKANEKILTMFENTNSLFTDPFDEPEARKTIEFIRKNKKYADKYPTILKCRNYAKGLFNESDKENMETRQKILDELKIIFYNHKDEILKLDC
jgi:hypothetical protein